MHKLKKENLKLLKLRINNFYDFISTFGFLSLPLTFLLKISNLMHLLYIT